ncbi:MAG: hypothetical protein Q8O40_10310 [Chloroflexota bacterium]|nr:hypothetical protein [Chloroflexota bacterium]
MMVLSVSRTLAVQLVGAALVASLLALFAACAAVATPTPSATPTTTSTPAPTPTPSLVPTPTAAFNPFATGTPTPPPTPTPTPTISVAPADLPPAAHTPELERRMTVIGRWEPEHPGAFQTLAEGQSKGKRYVFLGKENRLDLLEIAGEGPPKPTGVSIPVAGRPFDLKWEGDILAGCVSTQNGNALYVWDVGTVTQPRLLDTLVGVDRLLELEGRHAYVSRSEESRGYVTYLVPDIRRPQEMQELEGLGYVHGVDEAGGLAYVSRNPGGRMQSKFTVLDVSMPGTPRVVAELEGVAGSQILVAGGKAYVYADSWGLYILDVGDPEHPRVLSEPPKGPRSVSTLDRDDPVALMADGDTLYLLLYGGDWGFVAWQLLVLDISDPALPKEASGVEGRGLPVGMWLQGEQVVVAEWYGMTVVDVSDLEQPKEGERVPAGISGEVFLRGESAFLFTLGGIFALDLSQPEAPEVAAFRYFGPIGSASDLGEGKFRATLYGWDIAYEIDLSDPQEPRLEASRSDRPPTPRATLGPYELRAFCGSLYVEDRAQRRGDLMTVARLRLAESVCSDKWDVAAVDQDVYVVGNGKLYLFDASDPNSPKLLAEKALVGDGEQASKEQAYIVIADGRAYVLHGGLWVLDLSAPLQPKEVAYYPTDAFTLDVDGDGIALVGPDGSFELLKLDLER